MNREILKDSSDADISAILDKNNKLTWGPEKLTAPCLRYFIEDMEITTFLATVDKNAEHLDEVYKQAALAVDTSKPGLAEFTAFADSGVGAQALSRSFERLSMELFVCRTADIFVSYLAEMLELIFKTEPRTLASMEIKFKTVLDYPDMNDLVAALAEKRISSLSRDSFTELNSYFKKQHNITLVDDTETLGKINYYIALRNLIVHHHRIADSKFVHQSGSRQVEIGKPVIVEVEELQTTELMRGVVAKIDERIATKYKIDRPYTNQQLFSAFATLRTMGNDQPVTTQEPASPRQ